MANNRIDKADTHLDKRKFANAGVVCKSRFRRRRGYLLVCPLIFWIGLVTLLKSANYPVLATESLAALAVFVIFGVAVGSIIAFMGRNTEILSISFLIFLLCNLLYRPFPDLAWLPFGVWGLPLVIFIATIFLISIMGKNRVLFLAAISTAFLLGSFLVQPTSKHWESEKFVLSDTAKSKLPPYIHIIVDEHIGLDGILREFEVGGELISELPQSYEQLGFRSFSRAFSRYKITKGSFSSFMNFKPQATPEFKQHSGLQFNGLFNALSERGYSINVFQTTSIDLCKENGSSFTLASCYTYPFSPLIEGLSHSSLPVASKSLVMINTVIDRTGLVSLVENIAASGPGLAIGLPEWPIRTCLKCIAAETALRDFEVATGNVQPGQAVFLHLMMPHGPYQNYDDECRPDFSMSFKSASFNNRYSRYLKQVRCTQQRVLNSIRKIAEQKDFDGGTIVVHGDHGTRVYSKQNAEFTPGTVKTMQAFSTFFAVRADGYTPGVDTSPLPLDVLLSGLHRGVADGQHSSEGTFVMYPEGWGPLHPFSEGELTSEW